MDPQRAGLPGGDQVLFPSPHVVSLRFLLFSSLVLFLKAMHGPVRVKRKINVPEFPLVASFWGVCCEPLIIKESAHMHGDVY